MKSKLIYLLFIMLFGCSPYLKDKANEQTRLTDTSEVLIQAQKNILYKNKTAEGIDTLEIKLLGRDYDSQLFDSYHALIFGYLYLSQIEKADSVWNLINRSKLSPDEEILWLGDAYMISLETNRFQDAFSYLSKIYKHPSSQM